MTNENKLSSMDAVGELPDFGNLLLREGGFPHLPASQSDVWNEAGTKPDHPCLCETKNEYIESQFQYWNGHFFGYAADDEKSAMLFKDVESVFQSPNRWREVQP